MSTKPRARGFDVRERSDERTQAADLDAQARAVRLVGVARAKCTLDQRVAVYVTGPCLGESARQCKQHRPARQRQPSATGAQAATARIDHQCSRREQRFDFIEAQRLLITRTDLPRSRVIERSARLGHLRLQCGHARVFGCHFGACERRSRGGRAQRAQRHLGSGQLGHCEQRRRHAACVELAQLRCGLVEAPEQQQPAHRDQACVQRVGAIGTRLERGGRGRQRARRATEIAHRQRHFGLRHDAAGARQLLVRAEAARGAPQQLAGTRVLAELRHRDAAQRQRRRVVAQAHAFEGGERVAGSKSARGSGDQGIHRERLPCGAGRHPDGDLAARRPAHRVRWHLRNVHARRRGS